MDGREPEDHVQMVRKWAAALHRDVKRFTSVEVDELVSEGHVALEAAKLTFDPEKRVRFEAYAYTTVRGKMVDAVRRMTNNERQLRKLLARLGIADTVAQEAGEHYLEQDKSHDVAGDGAAVAELIDGSVAMLIATLSVGAVAEVERSQTHEDSMINDIEITRMQRAVGKLQKNAQTLLRGIYYEDRTLEDIGRQLGLHKSRVSRLHIQVLKQLRAMLEGPP